MLITMLKKPVNLINAMELIITGSFNVAQVKLV